MGPEDTSGVQHTEYDDEGNVIPETWPTEATDVPAGDVRSYEEDE